MTAGLPDPEHSADVFETMIGAGADGCEIGIPYADPLMDGPIIQQGSDLALSRGTTIDRSLQIIGEVVTRTDAVSLAMTYANPVFRRGVDWFCSRLASVGAEAIIVPDLPVEESAPLIQACRRHGLGTVQFVAPTSGRRRIELVAETHPTFVYAVAELGVTGERRVASSHAERLVESIRSVTNVPIVFGVGIGSPESAAAARTAGADGVIVGSALVRTMLEGTDLESSRSALARQVKGFVEALRA